MNVEGDIRIADAHVRKRALVCDRSFLVQAPAGSGKTELLVRRFLALLAQVERPEEIVAVTFTRKAAGEMRGRVIEALALAGSASRPNEPYQRELWDLGQAALENAKHNDWQLDDSPGRLQIHTIDALCAWLTQRLPIVAGLGVQTAVSEDPDALYREAVRLALSHLEFDQRWSSAIEDLLTHLDNDFARLEQLLVNLLGRRDQWMRHVEGDLDTRRDKCENALAALIGEHLARLRNLLPDGCGPPLLVLARFAAENLERDERASPIRACRDLEQIPEPDSSALDCWLGIAELLLTKGGTFRRRLDARCGFPPSGRAAGAAEAERLDAMKDDFKKLVELLSEFPGLEEALSGVADLPPAHYADTQWKVLAALTEVLRLAVASLLVIFAEHGEVDFQAMADAALAALGPPDEPTDLALALDYRIRHVLVDEFQDTSYTQYELLERLTAGWSADDGRSLFLVGDPMQSIYSFREAEVGVFLRVQRSGKLGTVAIESLQLHANFRSQAGLIEWLNRSFPQVLPNETDIGLGAVPYSPVTAVHPAETQTAVEVHPQFSDSADREAHEIGELVQQKRSQRPDETLAIIVRNRNHLPAIVSCLRRHGLRFRAVDIDPLETRAAVQDLFALTRALLHPGDRIAWLAVLRAPWCGLRLADLEVLSTFVRGATLPAVLGVPGAMNRISEDGRRRLSRVAPVLLAASTQRQRGRLRPWIESTWLQLGGPACTVDEVELADARAYLDLLERFGNSVRVPDVAALHRALGELYASPDTHADEHLQIMTIHKAKGLEFDHVILPGLGRGARRDEHALLAWLHEPSPDRDDRLLLAPISATGEEDAIYRFIRTRDSRRRQFEEARLCYVAATRAKRSLHLFGHVVPRISSSGELNLSAAAGSLLARIWPAVHSHFESALGEDVAAYRIGSAVTVSQSLRRLGSNWQLPDPPAPVQWTMPEGLSTQSEPGEPIEYQWASPSIRHVGTVVHDMLSRIGEEGLRVWSAARLVSMDTVLRNTLAHKGVPIAEIDSAAKSVQQALRNTIADERGRWVLDEGHRDAHCELALSGVYAGRIVNVVLDRTFIDSEGVRWIIDYKTSAHQGGEIETFLDRESERYRDQLEKYARLMSGLEARSTRVALYFPLLGAWREWAPELG